MDQEQPHGSYQPNAKRKKPNDENNDGESSTAAVKATNNPASTAGVQQSGKIFKLDIDCFEEAFDYLPFIDLVSVGKTCKRLQQVAGYCFQQNYSGRALNVDHFVPFIQKIGIDSKTFENVFAVRSKLNQLKQMSIMSLETDDIYRLKKFNMDKLEKLRIRCSKLGSDFHEIIDRCPKLKRLEIRDCTGENYWFMRKYPTLEHLEIAITEFFRGIPMFLELNPNIRKFATYSTTLWTLHDKIKASNVKLDDLAIQIFYENDDQFKLLCDLFNDLHKRGFYRKLQLYLYIDLGQEQINLLADVNGLAKLYVPCSTTPFSFSALKSLEEICLDTSKKAVDLEILPNNLINLKRIQFGWASIDDIMPFIRRSVEMQRIKVDYLGTVYFNEETEIVDLLALNREREQLPDAQKITLYVKERVYLATKWALGETDLRLVRLKRQSSFEWRNDFIEVFCHY